MGLSVFDEVSVWEWDQNWSSAQSTNKTALFSGVTPTIRIDNWVATSTDTVDHLAEIWYANAWIDTITIPAGAGNGTVPPVDMIAKLKADCGLDHILMSSTKAISVRMQVAISASKNIYWLLIGGYLPAI